MGRKMGGDELAGSLFFIAVGVLLLVASFMMSSVSALTYSKGSYGTCQYDTCSISVASSSVVNLSLLSSAGTACSVASDAVTVSTRSSTGYSVVVSSTTSNRNLTGVSNGSTISPASGTAAAPAALATNTWGYRVDSGAFGAGPTSAVTNTGVPSLTFAGMPVAASPSYVASSNAAATNATTNVWYGVCVDSAKVADTYTNDIVYTAAIN